MQQINYWQASAQQIEGPQQAQLAKLIQQGFAWSETLIDQELKSDQTNFILAEQADSIVAYLSYRQIFDQADLIQIYVAPAWRRLGIARDLLNYFQGLMDLQTIYLEVRASNIGAINLYQSQNFSQVSCRPAYYQQPREDAIIMIWERSYAYDIDFSH